MMASWKGHHEIVRTLLENQADVNAQRNVRNHHHHHLTTMMMMMMIIIIVVLTIVMMVMMIVINYEDRDDLYRC